MRGGALLGIGVLCSGVRDTDINIASALLAEHIESPDPNVRTGAAAGLGVAYSGSASEEVNEELLKMLRDPADGGPTLEEAGFGALALGLVNVGKASNDVSTALLTVLAERDPTQLIGNKYSRLLSLGLGLCYLGRGNGADVVMETIDALGLEPRMASFTKLALQVCAYAGTGDVVKFQEFLGIAGEQPDEVDETAEPAAAPAANGAAASPEAAAAAEAAAKQPEGPEHQFLAVLGCALVSLGEEMGQQMSLRTMAHLLQYGTVNVKRTVPLALAIAYASNPQLEVTDMLSKLTHNADERTHQAAILGLGLIAAGTNNARIASALHALAVYHAATPDTMFFVRVAQGLLHMGKGLLSLSPFHDDHQLLSPVALAGLLSVVFGAALDTAVLLGHGHILLHNLAAGLAPRMLIALDEELEACPVPVRVGTAVDAVGKAGRPKTITGFIQHETPVVIHYEQRAEIVDECGFEAAALGTTLEGFVIVKKVDVEAQKAAAKAKAKALKNKA